MSRLIPQCEMTAAQITGCCSDAAAIVRLCSAVAWSIQNGSDINLAGAMMAALDVAGELLGPVTDALEVHEGLKGGQADG